MGTLINTLFKGFVIYTIFYGETGRSVKVTTFIASVPKTIVCEYMRRSRRKGRDPGDEWPDDEIAAPNWHGDSVYDMASAGEVIDAPVVYEEYDDIEPAAEVEDLGDELIVYLEAPGSKEEDLRVVYSGLTHVELEFKYRGSRVTKTIFTEQPVIPKPVEVSVRNGVARLRFVKVTAARKRHSKG